MKQFLKFTLASVVGIVLSSMLLFFIGALILFGVATSSDSEITVSKDSIVLLDLSGNLVERAEDNPFADFLGNDQFTQVGMDDVLSAIRKAKENEKIKGLYLKAGMLNASYAHLQEIRDALKEFKKSGKFIIAYGDQYAQNVFYLCSVADKVILNPQGAVEWQGLASQPVFYKNLLDKVGVEMQIFKVGTYKSYVEPYTSTKMSDANREQVTAYLGSVWNEILTAVSSSRKLTKEQLNAVADRGALFLPAKDILKEGLVDTLMYRNEVRDYVKGMLKLEKDDSLPLLSVDDMTHVEKNVPKDKSGNILAVYYADGAIDDLAGRDEGIHSNEVINDLRKLKEDEDVKAVVLRINSPGGSAFGSEQMWQAITELKKEKPVVVSMGSYAASGGYYMACNADAIVAQPTTLTGSIGIFGMIPNVQGLTQKIGLDMDAVKTNTYADLLGGGMRPMSEGEKALFQSSVERGYDLFLTRTSTGRKKTKEAMNEIAQGRVWTGTMAKQIGLVDELGGLEKAKSIALKRAKIDKYTVVNYPAKEDFFSMLLDMKPAKRIKTALLKEQLGTFYEEYSLLKGLQGMDKVQARVPFDLNIH